MYYKIYRRRNKLYIIIGVILLIFLYFDFDKDSSGNERKDNLNDLDEVFKVIEEKLDRKPKKRYVPPEPCKDCPGENGQGVMLTVS